MKVILLVIPALILLSGCGGHSPMLSMTPTQQDGLQVRDIDAAPDRAFAAATNTLVNAGYTIGVTDGEGGLLTGIRRRDPSVAEHVGAFVLSALLTMGHYATGAAPEYFGVSVQVLPRPGDLASVRICLYGHGNLKEEEAIIDDLWIQMQRDVLAKAR